MGCKCLSGRIGDARRAFFICPHHLCVRDGADGLIGALYACAIRPRRGGGGRCEMHYLILFCFWYQTAQIFGTRGLISADRRTKPTLMLTIPRSNKVVYKGFISSNIWNCDSAYRALFFIKTTRTPQSYGTSQIHGISVLV